MHNPNRFSLSYFVGDAMPGQFALKANGDVRQRKTTRFSAEQVLVEIVVRIAHVGIFRLVPDFRRKFCVAAMNVRNV